MSTITKITFIRDGIPGIVGSDTVPPTVPGTPFLVPQGETGMSVTWSASTDTGSGVLRYHVWRRSSGAFVEVAAPSVNGFSDSGLSVYTQYQYYITAEDIAGNISANSGTSTATTLDTHAPTTPGTPTITPVAATMQLAWTASTDNDVVFNYRVYRKLSSVSTYGLVGSPSGNSFTDSSGLVASTSYDYYVVAIDRAGNASASSGVATGTTTAFSGSIVTKLGANLNSSAYYSTHKHCINMLQDDGGGHGWWHGSTQDDNAHPNQDQWGRIINLPAGDFAKHGYGFCGSMDRLYGEGALRAGDYVMRHTGGGKITLQDASANVTNIVQVSNGRVTFTLTTPLQSTNLNLWIENITGAVMPLIDTTNTLVCRAELETSYDAGERFLPEALAFYDHYTTLRVMDINGTIPNTYRQASDLPAVGHHMWGQWPPEFCTKFCTQVGADMWYTMPAPVQHLKAYTCDPATDTIQFKRGYGSYEPLPSDWANGDQVFFMPDQITGEVGGVLVGVPMFAGQDSGPYYLKNINTAAGTFQISATSGGAAIDITASINTVPEYMRMCTKFYDPVPLWRAIFARIYAENPAINLKLEFSDEVAWNFGTAWRSNWYWLYVAGSYMKSGGTLTVAGTDRMGNGGTQSLGYITLLMMKTALEYFPRNQLKIIYPGQHINEGTITGMDYVDVNNLVGTGGTKKVYELVDAACVTSYITCVDPITNYQDFSYDYMIRNHWESIDDATIEAGFMRMLATIQTWQTRWNNAMAARNPALEMYVYEGCLGLGGPVDVTTITCNPIGSIVAGDTIVGQTTGTTATVLFVSGTSVQFLDNDVTGGTGYFDTGAYPVAGENILKGGVVQGVCSYSGRPLNDPVDQVTQRMVNFVHGSGGAAVRTAWSQYHATNNIALFCQFPGAVTWDVTDHQVVSINGMAKDWDSPNSYTAHLLANFITNP